MLLKILRVEVPDAVTARERSPGEIISADRSGLIVACGEGALRILELQREGGKRLDAAQFLAGHLLQAGARLG